MFPAELVDAVGGGGGVRNGFVAAFQNAEPDAADAAVVDFGTFRPFFSSAGPLGLPAEAAMPEFPLAEGFVAGILELGDERLLRFDGFFVGLAVVIDSGGARTLAAEKGGPGGIADRGGAMGVGEGDAHFGKTVDVGSLGLGVAAEVANPVVEVIDGDEEDVGPD